MLKLASTLGMKKKSSVEGSMCANWWKVYGNGKWLDKVKKKRWGVITKTITAENVSPLNSYKIDKTLIRLLNLEVSDFHTR